MPQSLLALRAPSANRVYAQAAGALAQSEAHWVLGARRGRNALVREVRIGGMEALEASAPEGAEPLDAEDARLLASLSGTLGVLERVPASGSSSDAGETLLRALDVPRLERHPSDLETTLKYPGKTNEQFTAMLINLAAALSTRAEGLEAGTLDLLDPMCGRGTTLNRALRIGLSPIGADLDRKDVEAYGAFLTTWLRRHRYKHRAAPGRLRLRGEHLGPLFEAELAPDKDAQRAGRSQSVRVLGCDAARLPQLLSAGSVDVIVTDLPYGVQHGARAEGRLSRSPLETLRLAAPGWRTLLRQGGAMALAVNRRTLDHGEASAALAAAGLRVLSADGAFRHRVDQAIDRDVLLAVREDHPRAERLARLGRADPPASAPDDPAQLSGSS